jgi:OPT oligopeptide transporter protein
VAPGRYLAAEGKLAYHLRDVRKFDAPKASLFALIIDGILTRKLPWSLVLVGVMLAIVMELCGVASLPFAVGVYLPLSTSVPIFAGGVVRYVVDRRRKGKGDEDFSPGTLLSSGYIAGGAIAGLVGAVVAGLSLEEKVDVGAKLADVSPKLGALCQSNYSGILAFGVIAVALYVTATRGEAAVGGVPAAHGEDGSPR